MFNTPQEPAQEPAVVAPEATQEQGNWEARFKGLQREYNGTKGYATNLQNQLNALKLERDSEATEAQGKIVQISADLESARKRAELAEKELASLRTANQQLERDQAVRKTLAKDFNDLTPWYDSGYLKVENLEGEALTEHLKGFRLLLGTQANHAVEQTLRGSSPPMVTPGNTQGDMTTEQLAEWLMNPANDTSPERDAYRELYYSKL